MAGFLNFLTGSALDKVGTALNLPEFGLSENAAGMQTGNTGRVAVADGVGISNQGQRLAQDAYNANTGRMANMNFGTATINPNGGLGIGGGATDGAGSVNGATTSQLPTAGAAGGPGQGFYQSLLNTATGAVNSAYDRTVGQLGANQNFLQGQASGMIDDTSRQYGQQKQGLEFQRGQAMSDLDKSQQDIDANRKDALSDLTSDLRTQMESFTRYLGAMGAVDSSASGMGQYAFGRLGQQARSDIWKQANTLASEVGTRREQVGAIFQDNLRQLNDWKTNQMSAIQQELAAKFNELDQARMSADSSRLQQLDELKLQAQQQAISTAMQVDGRFNSITQATQQWATQQAQGLDAIRQQAEQALQAIQFQSAETGMQTGVANNFNFGAGDIQSAQGNQGGFMQALLPQARRDEQAL